MSNELNALAERVASLEQTVAQLQSEISGQKTKPFDRKRWAVTDEAALEEITRLGREFRLADRPTNDPGSKP
jgi:hypothetical protein